MQGSFLRFYVHEGQRHQGRLLWEWLLIQANERGIHAALLVDEEGQGGKLLLGTGKPGRAAWVPAAGAQHVDRHPGN